MGGAESPATALALVQLSDSVCSHDAWVCCRDDGDAQVLELSVHTGLWLPDVSACAYSWKSLGRTRRLVQTC